MALNLADNADARLETLSEIFKANAQRPMDEWLGFNRIFESNIRRTGNIDELK
jgi:3'-5' exoribonuclease